MTRGPDSTLPSQRIPAVVLIAPDAALLSACERMARRLDEAPKMKASPVTAASSTVAEWRPFALIVPEPVFAFDPPEFESLAQTVGAEVMVVPPSDSTQLEALLLPRLEAALSWWQARRAVAP